MNKTSTLPKFVVYAYKVLEPMEHFKKWNAHICGHSIFQNASHWFFPMISNGYPLNTHCESQDIFLSQKPKSSIFTPCKTYHLKHYPTHISHVCKFVKVVVPNDDEIHLVWWYTKVVLSLNIAQLSFEVWNLVGTIINTCDVLFHQTLVSLWHCVN
jgi:hypothetical protein